MPFPPTLDIVTVNWNAGALLADCVASLPAALDGGVRLERMVVVDNASTDGSADGLATAGVPLVVVRNAANRGFAAACNQGAAGSRADYLLFLNPDVRLFPGALSGPLAVLEAPEGRGVGILGIRLVDEAGVVQRSCARAPTPGRLVGQSLGLDRVLPRLVPPHFMVEWDHADSRDVDQVMGAFLLIRRALFEELGGFDERFFVYFDDVDLCLRARARGWRVRHHAGAAAYHRGCGTTERVKDVRLFYALRSRVLFAAKHFGRAGAAAVAIAALLLEPAVRLAHALARRSPDEGRAVVAGTRLLWRALPEMLGRLAAGPETRREAARALHPSA